MTVEEFILLDKAKVRRDSNLMHLYLEFFEKAFGRVPNCSGCSFGSDWQKLVSKYSKNSVTLQKVKIMANQITIKKIQGKILSYKKDGKTYRLYDNILNDAFIKEFISNGTEEEIAERKKLFNFPLEENIVNIPIDTSKAEEKIVELKNTLNENSTKEEIEKGINEYVNLIEVKVKGKRGRKPKNG